MGKPKQTKSQVPKPNQSEVGVDREERSAPFLEAAAKQQEIFLEVQREVAASVSQCYKSFQELATFKKLNRATFQELVKGDAFATLIKNGIFKELINNAAFTELINNDLFSQLINENAIEELIGRCDNILDDCESGTVYNFITEEMLARLSTFSVNDVLVLLIKLTLSPSSKYSIVDQENSFEEKQGDQGAVTMNNHRPSLFFSNPDGNGFGTVQDSSGEDSAGEERSVALKQTPKSKKGPRKLAIVKDSEEELDPEDSSSATSGSSEEDESSLESSTEGDSEL
ncbi:MAG: hypothetical protein Q9196_000255 [Gyalolechia fulgens]